VLPGDDYEYRICDDKLNTSELNIDAVLDDIQGPVICQRRLTMTSVKITKLYGDKLG